MYRTFKKLIFATAFLFAAVVVLCAQVSPYRTGQHSPQAATPQEVQAAVALCGEWLLVHGDTTNLVTITHITGKIVVMENAGLLSQRYLRSGDKLLRFIGSGEDKIRAAWHIDDNLLEIREGDFAGARLTRIPDDEPDGEDEAAAEDDD